MLKIEMGVGGAIFEPHPPNLVKIHIFLRSSNDRKNAFWLNPIGKKLGKNNPGVTEIFGKTNRLA